MPTKTFFNLPEAKQKMLLKAAEKEFSRVLYRDASINKIVQNANISRGSFYMYFENKEDLYLYIIKRQHTCFNFKLIDNIKKGNGDFLIAIEKLYEECLLFLKNSDQKDILKNMFLNMKEETNSNLFEKARPDLFGHFEKELLDIINFDLYRFKTSLEIIDAFHLSMMVMINAIISNLLNIDGDISKQKETFYRRLNIIKYGLYQERIDN